MGTPLQTVWDSFLARITADDWMNETIMDVVKQDWRQLLDMSIYRVKYPRVSLSIDNATESFTATLTSSEIQLLAIFMKHEWLKRCIADWENVKQSYTDRDFSQANLLDKLVKLGEQVAKECAEAYKIYDRAVDGKPFDFGQLAGKQTT